jgi:hypothetical protein
MSMKSFTTNQTRIDFDIDGEVFFLRAGIAAGQMVSVSALAGEIQAAANNPDTNVGKILLEKLGEIFEEDSFKRFENRFWGKDSEGKPVPVPIDMQTFNAVIEWIFGEALGKGTTQQS